MASFGTNYNRSIIVSGDICAKSGHLPSSDLNRFERTSIMVSVKPISCKYLEKIDHFKSLKVLKCSFYSFYGTKDRPGKNKNLYLLPQQRPALSPIGVGNGYVVVAL